MNIVEGDVTKAPKPSLSALLIVLFAFTCLCALGTWQIQRRAWKLDLIAQVDSRATALAVNAPALAEWPNITAAKDAYRHVQLHGTFLNDHEVRIDASTKLGVGSWVITPIRTDEGFVVLVNRGFVPSQQKDISLITQPITVTGLLRLSEPHGRILRPNQPDAGLWYSCDVAAIAAKEGLTNAALYYVDAENMAAAGQYPVGGLTVISFPNNHLLYAITWFGLAFLLAGTTAAFIYQNRRVRKTH